MTNISAAGASTTPTLIPIRHREENESSKHTPTTVLGLSLYYIICYAPDLNMIYRIISRLFAMNISLHDIVDPLVLTPFQ